MAPGSTAVNAAAPHWSHRAPWVGLIRHSPMLALTLALALLPLVVSDDYVIRIFVQIGIYVLLTASLNLVNGYGGMFSVGHAAFFGVGAYASALWVMKLGLPFSSGLVFGAAFAALLGWLIAKPTLKLVGVYLTLVTLGLNIIVMLVLLNWDELTRGPLGIAGVPAPRWLGQPFASPQPYYYLVLAVVAVVLFGIARLVDSRFGRALMAVREDEKAAATSGVDVAWTREVAFTLAAAIAGAAGSIYAHYLRYISPDAFGINESFVILAMLAFGGPGTLVGPVAGAAILVGITEAFRAFSDWRMIIYGTVLIATMLLRREGLFGGRAWRLQLDWPPSQKPVYARGDRFLAADDGPDDAAPGSGGRG
jgi:branched-chain amino acid transport system permease protein